MQLCLMIEGQEGVAWPQWLALAHACEQHGIPALFRSDHYLNLDGRHPEHGSLDAWGTLNALAAVTSRVRLGTLVSPATFRHPSLLAKLVTTADHVSGGRRRHRRAGGGAARAPARRTRQPCHVPAPVARRPRRGEAARPRACATPDARLAAWVRSRTGLAAARSPTAH